MNKFFTLLAVLCCAICQSQNTDNDLKSGIFEKITAQMSGFKVDTSSPPTDKLTRKIIELRNLRGGFNINEALEYKISEELNKPNAIAEDAAKMSAFFQKGDGKRWLDNAVIWIYRNQFTYEEIKMMVKFYKTSAGQKMAANFPIVMMQSLQAAEEIGKMYEQQPNK